jgi:hypothetical protein
VGAKLGKTVGIYRSAKADEKAGLAKPRGALERLKGSWKGLAHPEYDDKSVKEEVQPKTLKQFKEGWEEMMADVKKRAEPKPNGGSGVKQGSRYGGSKQKDTPEQDTEKK